MHILVKMYSLSAHKNRGAMDPSKQEAIANLEIEMMTDLYNRCANVC